MAATQRQLATLAKGAAKLNVSTIQVVEASADKSLVDALKDAFPKANVKTVGFSQYADGKQDVDVIVVDKALPNDKLKPTEVDEFLHKTLSNLRDGGILLLRNNLASIGEDSIIPQMSEYFEHYRAHLDNRYSGYELYAVEQIDESIHRHHNWLDVAWALRKKDCGQECATFRNFLDKTQYTVGGISAYEWIFGKDFISPGGAPENLRVLNRFSNLHANKSMLDIGSGIGGGVRQAAEEFGLLVTGVDLSSNMLNEAILRVHREKDSRVRYIVCDAVTYAFAEESYDFVFSRDCIQHIPATEELFKNLYKALRPGGQILITMYGAGAGEQTEKFKKYVEDRAYFLKTRKQIEEIAHSTGFVDVKVENWTPRFAEILEEERERLIHDKADFFSKNHTEKDFNSLHDGWTNKLGYIKADNHNWNFFHAVKPLNKH